MRNKPQAYAYMGLVVLSELRASFGKEKILIKVNVTNYVFCNVNVFTAVK